MENETKITNNPAITSNGVLSAEKFERTKLRYVLARFGWCSCGYKKTKIIVDDVTRMLCPHQLPRWHQEMSIEADKFFCT